MREHTVGGKFTGVLATKKLGENEGLFVHQKHAFSSRLKMRT